MGPGKPSTLVTTLSNHSLPALRWFMEGEWGSLGWRPGRTITRNQDFTPRADTRFWPSINFVDGCFTWDPWARTYDVLIRFFPYRVYTDLNCYDTLGYEWPLVVAVILEYVLSYWWHGLEDVNYDYVYHGYYCIYFICFSDACFMHVIAYWCKTNILAQLKWLK
jgi:hypothetical protein